MRETTATRQCDLLSNVYMQIALSANLGRASLVNTIEGFHMYIFTIFLYIDTVVTMYDRSSADEGVKDVRLDIFAWKQRPYESVPPT